MKIQYCKHYSGNLNRDMEFIASSMAVVGAFEILSVKRPL